MGHPGPLITLRKETTNRCVAFCCCPLYKLQIHIQGGIVFNWTNPCDVLHLYHPFNEEYINTRCVRLPYSLRRLFHFRESSGLPLWSFNDIFNTISVISRWSVLLVEETGVPRKPPIFHGKHADRFTILKHTGLKVPQNSNTFNDVNKCINNPNNPVVLFPSN
jgi:hypothetical protein